MTKKIVLIVSLFCINNIKADGQTANSIIIGDQKDFSLRNPEGLHQICLTNFPVLLDNNLKYIANRTKTTFAIIVLTYTDSDGCGIIQIPSSVAIADAVIAVDAPCGTINQITLYEQVGDGIAIITPPGTVTLTGSDADLDQSITFIISQDSNGYHIDAYKSASTTERLTPAN
jgi:hypothetical protein